MSTKYNLPPLPEPAQKAVYATAKNSESVRKGYKVASYKRTSAYYTDDQMCNYAIEAIEANRATRPNGQLISDKDYLRIFTEAQHGSTGPSGILRGIRACIAAYELATPALDTR